MDKEDDDELFPLSHFATNRVKLINEAFSVLRGQRLESTIIPPSLRGIDYTELKSLCLEELRKIDTLRIVDVIEGRVAGGGSNSNKNEATTVDHQVKRRKRHSGSEPSIPMSELKKKIKKVINEDDNESCSRSGDDNREVVATRKVVIKKKNKIKKKKHGNKASNQAKSTSSPTTTTSTIVPATKGVKKVKVKNGEKVKMKKIKKLKKEKKADKVKKKSNQGKVEERSGAIPGERTLMELLELEYRAKAIKALLKFQGFNATTIDDVFNDSDSPPAPVVTKKVSEPKKPTTVPSASSFADDKNENDSPPPLLLVTKVSELKKPITMPSTSSIDDKTENDEEENNSDEENQNETSEEEEGETNDNDEGLDSEVINDASTTSVAVFSSPSLTNIHEELDYGDEKKNNGDDEIKEDEAENKDDDEENKDNDDEEDKDNNDEENKDNNDEEHNANNDEEHNDDEVLDNVNEATTNVAVSSSPFHSNIHEELDYGDGRDGDGEEVTIEYPDEATPITWYERWYSSKKVQTVVNSNKMYGKVRHKLRTNKKEKKIADEFTKDKLLESAKTKSSNCSVRSKDVMGDNDSDNIPLIGSIQEYEQIFGKKIINPSQNQNVDVNNTDTTANNNDVKKLDDMQDVESEDDDDNELWGDIMGNT